MVWLTNMVPLALALVAAPSAPVPPAAGAAPALQVKRVLSFAGADRVRVDVLVGNTGKQAVGGAEVSARIAPWPGGPILWEGPLGAVDLDPGAEKTVSREVAGLKPRLWSPTTPRLYRLDVTVSARGTPAARGGTRFGFRSFETRNGQFYLNGTPIFLRGNSINPPGRGVPEAAGRSRRFAEEYLRDLKSRHVNLVRLDDDLWLDVCDELGMMVFAGRYGAPRGGTRATPPDDFDAAIAAYKGEYFERYQAHPSIVISVLTNEMLYRGEQGEAYLAWLDRVHQVLKQWDPNRLYIGNAGFGRGRGGEIYDVHPYWGWYGGSFLDYYRLRGDPGRAPGSPPQPVTLSECIGAYTTPDGRFGIEGKSLSAALTWAGHAGDQAEAALAYQAFLAGQGIETFRRLRAANPCLAGIMPFTYIFFDWEGVSRFSDMRPKPVADQMRVSFQPVLLSWELWTPHVYAGAKVRAVGHVVNDDDQARPLEGATLEYELAAGDGGQVLSGRTDLSPVAYYEARPFPVELALPDTLATGNYTLTGRITRQGAVMSQNRTSLFVAAPDWAAAPGPGQPVGLYDPQGGTAAALKRLGIPWVDAGDLSRADPRRALVIGEDAWDGALAERAAALGRFVRAGGRVLVLRQGDGAFSGDWPGASLAPSRAQGLWINPERPHHPAFAGVSRERLRYWSDDTGWDQTREGLPRVQPVTLGFHLRDPRTHAQTAILANFGRGLGLIALCEVFSGEGSAIVSGFDLIGRSRRDPVADRLLANLVRYTVSPDGHERHPFINSPITWGDYASERGVVAGPHQGLVVAARKGTPLGRRPLGPYGFGGATGTYVVDPRPELDTGSGVFCARIPAGCRWVVTQVANPMPAEGRLDVRVNGRASGQPVEIASGATTTIRTPVPPGVTDLSVAYTGHKELILQKTSFE